MAYYNEAEEFSPKIWALAQEMKRFRAEQGRPPNNLDEIDEYSTAYDFGDLGEFDPLFGKSQERQFYIRINPKFGFSISSEFSVEWLQFYQ